MSRADKREKTKKIAQYVLNNYKPTSDLTMRYFASTYNYEYDDDGNRKQVTSVYAIMKAIKVLKEMRAIKVLNEKYRKN